MAHAEQEAESVNRRRSGPLWLIRRSSLSAMTAIGDYGFAIHQYSGVRAGDLSRNPFMRSIQASSHGSAHGGSLERSFQYRDFLTSRWASTEIRCR